MLVFIVCSSLFGVLFSFLDSLCVFQLVQILVGPSDWKDYLQGKEGATRYRLQNLLKSSGPGVYELGVAVSQTGLGREIGKLDPGRIVVVYLGQADNVKTRLQHYGRTGAHLGNNYLKGCPHDSKSVCLPKGPGLFEEILSRGYPIVFRWAPVSISLLGFVGFLFMGTAFCRKKRAIL